ncbi:MAG: histidine kinase dimerization/phospho-acceptor domain-containing protein [Nitrososphaera sp.]|jgi:signal transduction histidine kinase
MKIKRKITNKIEKKSTLNDKTLHKIKELKQEKMILKELYKILNDEKITTDMLLSDISDKLKNPIVPIKAYVDMLLEGYFGKLNKKQKEKLELIKASAESLNEKISKINKNLK